MEASGNEGALDPVNFISQFTLYFATYFKIILIINKGYNICSILLLQIN